MEINMMIEITLENLTTALINTKNNFNYFENYYKILTKLKKYRILSVFFAMLAISVE